MAELTRYRVDILSTGNGLVADMRAVPNGQWVRYEDAQALVLEQRMIGHGDGQEHALADVNAGRVKCERIIELEQRYHTEVSYLESKVEFHKQLLLAAGVQPLHFERNG